LLSTEIPAYVVQLSVLAQIINHQVHGGETRQHVDGDNQPEQAVQQLDDAVEQTAEHDPAAEPADFVPKEARHLDRDACSSVSPSPTKKEKSDEASSCRPVKKLKIL